MKKIKTIIFDFDGVIADTLPFTISKTIRILKKDFSISLSDKEIIKIIQTNSFTNIIKILRLSLFKLPIIVGKINQSQEELCKVIDTIKIFPGIKKLLLDLRKQDLKLMILSSNLEKNVRKFLQLNQVDIFDYIDCGSHILGKATALESFLKKNNLKKENVIYVGDEIRDVEACKKAGVKIIAVSWGLNKKEALKSHGADFLVSKPSEILKIINKN